MRNDISVMVETDTGDERVTYVQIVVGDDLVLELTPIHAIDLGARIASAGRRAANPWSTLAAWGHQLGPETAA